MHKDSHPWPRCTRKVRVPVSDMALETGPWRHGGSVRWSDEEGHVPKTNKKGEPKLDELPSTLQRSPDKAQRTFAKAHDAAEERYGDGEHTNRVAFSALKHTHEKVGDHWEPKEEPGPSDPQAEGGVGTNRETAGGVDANASKKHLMGLARRLDVPGRSKMSKDELVDALQKANDRETRKARGNS